MISVSVLTLLTASILPYTGKFVFISCTGFQDYSTIKKQYSGVAYFFGYELLK